MGLNRETGKFDPIIDDRSGMIVQAGAFFPVPIQLERPVQDLAGVDQVIQGFEMLGIEAMGDLEIPKRGFVVLGPAQLVKVKAPLKK